MTIERVVGVQVGGDREMGGGGRQNLKKGYRHYRGSLHKVRELGPLCQLCKETLKVLPIMTICSKNFPSPITAISEKFHPPFMKESGGWVWTMNN